MSDKKSAAAWHPGGGPVKPLDLDAIRARAQEATSGPWTTMSPRPDGRLAVERPDYNPFTNEVSAYLLLFDTNPADAEFVAHAREDIPALLAALAAETARADQAVAESDGYKNGQEQVQADFDALYTMHQAEHAQHVDCDERKEEYHEEWMILARMVKAAPHAPNCSLVRSVWKSSATRCTCWKSAAPTAEQ